MVEMQGGVVKSVNRRIFWSSTYHNLATGSEALTSGCHGCLESDLKCLQRAVVRESDGAYQ